MKHTYYLDKPSAKVPTYVMFNYNCPDGRCKISIGEKIQPKEWRPDNSGAVNGKSVNAAISKINLRMLTLDNRHAAGGQRLTVDELKISIREALGESKVVKTEFGFFEMWDKIARDRATGDELNKGKVFSEGTIKSYAATRKVLALYTEKKAGKKLDMQQMSMLDYNSLNRFMGESLGQSLNSVAVTIKNLKAFMKAAYKRKYHTNLIHLDSDFSVVTEIPDNIHLSVEELRDMEGLQLNTALSITRDWFLVEAFTALRVSDIMRLKPVNLANDRIIIAAEKTNEPVIIPLHPILRSVLARNGGWPPTKARNTLNGNIKIIAKKLKGFESMILWTETRKGVRVDHYTPKYDMVSTHTGRRSFITNALQNGLTDGDVMKLAGIKSAATLRRYDKTTRQQVADKVAKLPFFN